MKNKSDMKSINSLKATGLFIGLAFLMSFPACKNKTPEKEIIISNPLNWARHNETVEVSKKVLGIRNEAAFRKYGIVDPATGKVVLYQLYDKDGDGQYDAILFQPDVPAGGTKTYIARYLNQTPDFPSKVYSRFVPERTDDYAWENDRVAFRTFGPTAERMVEQNIPGGTLTSGIDCWLKRVSYPIINRWYKKATTGKGSYHIDTGEGFDNYHVGASRGCGGFGIWKKDTLWVSRNFTHWKRIANGPIRTTFVLDYAHWKAGNKIITEKQTVSLDLGSNLSRIDVQISGTDTITAGLTLHKNKGEIFTNVQRGWFTYWEPHPDFNYEIGTAIVAFPGEVLGYRKYISGVPDHSHLFVSLKVKDGHVVYYSGFTWSKSKQFKDEKAWEGYLSRFSKNIQHPLKVSVR